MGNKCSKNSATNASENVDADARRDLEHQTNSLKSRATKDNFLEDMTRVNSDMRSLSHRSSGKISTRGLDSDNTLGVLPSQHGSISIDNNAQLSFKGQNSAFLNQSSGLQKSFNSIKTLSSRGSRSMSNQGSFQEVSHLSKQSSMAKSLHSYASTNVSENAEDNTIDMRSFTPFDMRKTDELAQFFVTQCGLGLSSDHNPLTCKICQTVDLSDAPLIA